MDETVMDSIIQQRWWDRYPASYISKSNASRMISEVPVEIPIGQNTISWPKIKFVQHSWDFVPPEVVKPLASSTVGDIAVIVRRTGMIWKAFDPHKGIMTAEGGPHVITSMEQKGLGIVLQYWCLDESLTTKLQKRRQSLANSESVKSSSKRRPQQSRRESLWGSTLRSRAKIGAIDEEKSSLGDDDDRKIGRRTGAMTRDPEASGIVSCIDRNLEGDGQYPHGPWPQPFHFRHANLDKILFGLVPSDPALGVRDFRHRTKQDVQNELKQLCRDGVNDEAIDARVTGVLWVDRYEFNDILGMVPEVCRQRGKPRPIHPTRNYCRSVMDWTRKPFAELITRYLDGEEFLEVLGTDAVGRPETRRVGELKGFKLPRRTDPPTAYMKFARDTMQLMAKKPPGVEPSIEYLEKLHDCHEDTTRYFVSISERIPFYCLLRMHFNSAIWASKQAMDDIHNKHNGILPLSEGQPWRNRNIELYFCYLPRYIDYMKNGKGETECTDEDLVIEAWLMLMTRVYLFQALHDRPDNAFKGDYLLTEFYRSRLPVWLA